MEQLNGLWHISISKLMREEKVVFIRFRICMFKTNGIAYRRLRNKRNLRVVK